MVQISILVPAAGCGSRAATNGNKILAPLCDKPLLWHTLRALTNAEAFPENTQPLELLIAARRDEFELIQPIIEDIPHSAFCTPHLVEGGATRQESVFNAARVARGDLVMVHDAARPLVSPQLIRRVIEAALQSGAALAALPCPDTVKQAAENGCVAATLDRSVLWLAQTPQVFRSDLFVEALKHAAKDNFNGTDCASLVEHFGHPVHLVNGEARNFKVTYPDDLERAAALLQTATLGR